MSRWSWNRSALQGGSPPGISVRRDGGLLRSWIASRCSEHTTTRLCSVAGPHPRINIHSGRTWSNGCTLCLARRSSSRPRERAPATRGSRAIRAIWAGASRTSEPRRLTWDRVRRARCRGRLASQGQHSRLSAIDDYHAVGHVSGLWVGEPKRGAPDVRWLAHCARGIQDQVGEMLQLLCGHLLSHPAGRDRVDRRSVRLSGAA